MMYTPIKKLSRVNTNLQQAMAASERIFAMLDTHTEVGERPDARPLKPTRASVEFQNVAFAYDDGHAEVRAAGRVVLRRRRGRWSRSSGSAARARRRSST